jgi:hypothetical protein
VTRTLAVVLTLIGCQAKPDPGPAATGSAAPAREPASASASAAPPAAAKTWYEGAWQGAYKAELFRIETAAGGIKAWKEDDGAKASGEGKLSIEASADGTVSGSASGPLGEHVVSGKVDGDRLALSLIPKEPSGFRGVILAQQADGGMQGMLNASTGDSLAARKASVTLARVAK